jgi:flagellar motor switch protein FliN/FliY
MSAIEQTLEDVDVEIEVVLGSARMPVHQLLRMGRGAVIGLNTSENEDVLILANDVPVAKAGIVVNEGRIGVAITKLLQRPSSEGGTTALNEVAQQAAADTPAPEATPA